MTKFIVYQNPLAPGEMEPPEQPDPQVVMAGLTEADTPDQAIHNLINAGTFQGGTLNAIDASGMTSFDVSVKATLKAATKDAPKK